MVSSRHEYVTKSQENVVDAFLDIVAEKDKDMANLYRTKLAVEQLGNDPKRDLNRLKFDANQLVQDLDADKLKEATNARDIRALAYDTIFESLRTDDQRAKGEFSNRQVEFTQLDGKIGDICVKTRNIAHTHLAEEYDRTDPQTAQSPVYTAKKFKEHKLSTEQVQELLDSKAIEARFSITAHPTNPTTVEYTKAGDNLAAVLDNPNAKAEDLKAAFRQVRDTDSMVRKQPQGQQLDDEGFDGAKVNKPLMKPALWVLGDGDGNTSQNAENLKSGIETLRDEVKTRYKENLVAIAGQLTDQPEAQEQADQMISRLDEKGYSQEKFKDDIRILTRATRGIKDVSSMVEDLSYRADTFGFQFAKIDLRHNAKDMMTTVAIMAEKAGLIGSAEEFKETSIEQVARLMKAANPEDPALKDIANIEDKLGESKYATKEALLDELNKVHGSCKVPAAQKTLATLIKTVDEQGLSFTDPKALQQEAITAQWLADDTPRGALEKLSALKPEDLGEAKSTAARIFGRLKVAGENPDMFNRLIIAENGGAHHALASLLALKTTGNKVGQDAQIDLVTLSESAPDLAALVETQKKMLSNPEYRAHVKARGKIEFQIAQSDSVRRHGFGAQDLQDTTIRGMYELQGWIQQQDFKDDFKDVTIDGFFGGGDALQRGGGHAGQAPHRFTLNALEASNEMGVPLFMYGASSQTIQGHQKGSLFNPHANALRFSNALVSEALYGHAKIEGLVPQRETPKGVDYNTARKLRTEANRVMREDYPGTMYNPAIDELMAHAPWALVKASGNASSRAAARGDDKAPRNGETAEAIVASNKKQILDQRAIGVERTLAHTGLHILATSVSIPEGLEALAKNEAAPGENEAERLNYVCKANKQHRDAMRNVSFALGMADYDTGWKMLTSQKQPPMEDVLKMANEFESTYRKPGDNKEYHKGPSPEHLDKFGGDEKAAQGYKDQLTLAWLQKQAFKTARFAHMSLTGEQLAPVEQLMTEKDANGQQQFTLKTPVQSAWADIANTMELRGRRGEMAHMLETKLAQKHYAEPNTPFSKNEMALGASVYHGGNNDNTPFSSMLARTSQIEVGQESKKLGRVESMNLDRTFAPLNALIKERIGLAA